MIRNKLSIPLRVMDGSRFCPFFIALFEFLRVTDDTYYVSTNGQPVHISGAVFRSFDRAG